MTLIRAQVVLQRDSGLPRDVIMNTFHFQTATFGPPTGADYDAVQAALGNFYNGNTGAGGTLGVYLSSLLDSGSVHRIKQYDMSQPAPRPVAYESTFSILTSNANPAPAEVALCLSFRAPLEAGTDPKNRRGRIYLGPLGVNAISVSVGNGADVAPAAALIGNLADAGKRLMDAIGPQWVIFSPTNNQSEIITHCWVDNAFDTQRRRGGRASSRQTRNAA
jgi:hypothetical protein